MRVVDRRDWKKIPVGSIIKVDVGDPLYGIVRAVLSREYSLSLILLAMNRLFSRSRLARGVYFRLNMSYVVGNFELLDLEEIPLMFGCDKRTEVLSELFKGVTPLEIIASLDSDYLYDRSRSGVFS